MLPPAFKDIVAFLLRAILHALVSPAHLSGCRIACPSSSSSSSAGPHHDVKTAPPGAATATIAAATTTTLADPSTSTHQRSSHSLDIDTIMSVWIARVQSSFAVTDTCADIRTQIEFYSALVLLLQCDRVRTIALTQSSSSSSSSSTATSNSNSTFPTSHNTIPLRSTTTPTTMTTAQWFANLLLSLPSENHLDHHRNNGTMIESLRSLCDGVRYPTFLTILRDCLTNDDIVDGQYRWMNQSNPTIEQQGGRQNEDQHIRNNPSTTVAVVQQGDQHIDMSISHNDDHDATTAMLRRLVHAQLLPDDMARNQQLQKLKTIFC